MFQGKDIEHQSTGQVANWSSCIYVQLYLHIQKHLRLARDELFQQQRDGIEVSFISNFYEKYFLCVIARNRLSNVNSGDIAYVWNTTKSNRKKYIGKFSTLDKDAMTNSIHSVFVSLKARVAQDIQYNFHLPTTKHSSTIERDILKGSRIMRSVNVIKCLKAIPYNLSDIMDQNARNPSGSLSVLHVLVTAIMAEFLPKNWEWTSLLKETKEKAIVAYRVLSSYTNSDSRFLVNIATEFNEKVANMCASGVHLLWNSQASFQGSWLVVHRAISSRFKGSVGGFMLNDLKLAVDTFSFSCNACSLNTMIGGGGNSFFCGINEKVVLNLKAMLLMMWSLEEELSAHKVTKNKEKSRRRKDLQIYLVKLCSDSAIEGMDLISSFMDDKTVSDRWKKMRKDDKDVSKCLRERRKEALIQNETKRKAKKKKRDESTGTATSKSSILRQKRTKTQ